MVWEQGKRHGGFSDVKPWLPVPSEHLPLSVDAQEANADSLLHYYRAAIEFRKSLPALVKGSQVDMKVEGSVVSFTRMCENTKLFCAFNLSNEESIIDAPEGSWNLLGNQLEMCRDMENNRANLKPFQALVAQSQ